MKINKIFICLALSLACTQVQGQAGFANPVIKGVADAGVLHWAGKYYLGGVHTYGDFFVSRNLVDWDRRVHVFDLDNEWTHGTGAKNNQVHANDMTYANGLFHLLFSVNYWGDDRHIVHITHATSPNVEGPYKEVNSTQWYENRIDPQVFCDDDGRRYLYMVKFTDGNTIWARPLNQDYTFAGEAVQQFSSQPDTWETYDNRVAEGPFVVKYRGRYYMMYNANHTGTEFGNYRLGVCEASSPVTFNPGGKYPWPVVSPQTEDLADRNCNLLVYGSGTYKPINLEADTIRFYLKTKPVGLPHLKIARRGECVLSLNGHAIESNVENEYSLKCVNSAWLNVGDNVIVVKRPDANAKLVALALYDMNEDHSELLLLTPGQPNIVRGPNGWEWWLVYMANEGWKRSQFVDRIHFSNSRLTVDGITDGKPSPLHPAPCLPQWSGTDVNSLHPSDAYLLELTTRPSSKCPMLSISGKQIHLPYSMNSNMFHEWRIEKNYGMVTAWVDNVLVVDHEPVDIDNNELTLKGEVEYASYNEGWDEYATHFSGWMGLKASDRGLSLEKTDMLKGRPTMNYELSTQLANLTPEKGRYGVYAAYVDKDNFVKVMVDALRHSLVIENCQKGKSFFRERTLADTVVVYPDVKYTDNFEKQYRFDAETFISSVQIPVTDVDFGYHPDETNVPSSFRRQNMASLLNMSYLEGDTWKPLKPTVAEPLQPGWQHLEFPEIKTLALRMINCRPHDELRHVYRIKTEVNFSANIQLRIEKQDNIVRVFANNRLMDVVTMKKARPSRVGLHSDGLARVVVKDMLWYARF